MKSGFSFAAPAADPNFPNSKAHGAASQLATLQRVVGLCEQRRTAIDIGAHIGTWSVELAKRFRSVHAFEPQAENFACLQSNTRGSAELHHVALGDGYFPARLAQHGGNSGCWHISEGAGVEMYTLDDYALGNVDLIKIDVEGYEGRVLRGASRTLLHSNPVIIFEDNGLGEKLYGAAWVDPKEVLIAFGYTPQVRIHKDEVWVRR